MAGGTALALQIGHRTFLDLEKQQNIKKMAKMKIPKKFQWPFWSYKIDSLDLKRDEDYIISQVLNYGTEKELKWLLKFIQKKKLKK